MSAKLKKDDLDKLKLYLLSKQIPWTGKLHRECSDASLVAKILKPLYPKLVDLHNYPNQNNTKLKYYSWETLNNKVLSKIGLQQTTSVLENLAKAVLGEAESLLYKIMKHEEAKAKRSKQVYKTDNDKIWTEQDEIMMIDINKVLNEAICKIPQKMIVFSAYQKVRADIKLADEKLNKVQQKIAHLENLLYLKSETIDELTNEYTSISTF